MLFFVMTYWKKPSASGGVAPRPLPGALPLDPTGGLLWPPDPRIIFLLFHFSPVPCLRIFTVFTIFHMKTALLGIACSLFRVECGYLMCSRIFTVFTIFHIKTALLGIACSLFRVECGYLMCSRIFTVFTIFHIKTALLGIACSLFRVECGYLICSRIFTVLVWRQLCWGFLAVLQVAFMRACGWAFTWWVGHVGIELWFGWSGPTGDLITGSVVATLSVSWHYGIGVWTGWPSVSVVWLGETVWSSFAFPAVSHRFTICGEILAWVWSKTAMSV